MSLDKRIIEVEDDLRVVFIPHRGQKMILYALLFLMKTLVFMQCGRKFGKCLDVDTLIPTPDGFKRIGDIRDGDIVFDEKGSRQIVLIAHDVKDNLECYRIKFDDNSYIDACEDHQWLTWTKKDRKNFTRGLSHSPSVKSTKDIFLTQKNGKEYNHSIPMCEPVSYSGKDLPIEPYLLGCWLGDGHSHSAFFTSMDEDIVDKFRERYDVAVAKDQNAGNATTYSIKGGLRSELRKLGLLGNKHIPSIYEFSDKYQRIALLKGLMDTDGTINSRGNSCEIIQKSKTLSDGIYRLISSLGMKPRQTVKIVNGVEYHRIIFRPRMNVFAIERKAKRYVEPKKAFDSHRTIVSVERIESKPMRCLTVSGESSLFLAGDNYIPTHNTDVSIYCLYWFAMVFDGCEVYYIADTMKHARELVWDNRRLPDFLKKVKRKKGESKKEFEERKRIAQSKYDKWVLKANDSTMKVWLRNGSVIAVDGAENYANADGLEPQFIVYDEFKHHDRRYNEAMEPNLDVYNGSMLVIGTPPETTDNYYCEVANDAKRRDDANFFCCPSYMNEFLYPLGKDDPKFAKVIKKYMDRGEEDILMREYFAKIITGGSGSIFPMFKPRPVDDFGNVTGYSEHIRPHDEIIGDIKKNPRDYDFYCSFDPGSATCFAVLFCAIHKRTNAVIFLDEIYATKMTETSTKVIFPQAYEKMMEIHADIDDWTLVYDNAALWFYNEVQANYGICMNPCTKDLKNKEAKLGQIKDVMLSGLWFSSERCVNLHFEIANYVKDKNGKIPKENDHLIDDMRYIFTAAHYDFTLLPEPVTIDRDELTNTRAFDDFVGYMRESLGLDLGYGDLIGEYYD